jgi:hypothetical protein
MAGDKNESMFFVARKQKDEIALVDFNKRVHGVVPEVVVLVPTFLATSFPYLKLPSLRFRWGPLPPVCNTYE